MTFTDHLLSEADLALAERDSHKLAAIARKLSHRVGDPLRDELIALALLCGTQLDIAASKWPYLRHQVEERVAIGGT